VRVRPAQRPQDGGGGESDDGRATGSVRVSQRVGGAAQETALEAAQSAQGAHLPPPQREVCKRPSAILHQASYIVL
jgi:hypothetical protein